jgi:hypothetical protein
MEAWHGTRGIAYSKKPDDFLKISGIIPQALPAEMFPRSGQRGFVAGRRQIAGAIEAAGGTTEAVAATCSRNRRDYDFPASLATTKIHSMRIRTGGRLESHCDMSANRRRPFAREHIPKIDRNFS